MCEEILVPKLRFAGFDDDWQETTLNDIATFSKGKGISKNDISEEGIECVRYGELYTKYGELIYNIDSKTNLNKNELVLSNKNDILIPCSGETAIDLATASCIQKEQVAIGGDITIIQTNQYAPFITYYLNQKKNEIARFAQGVSIVHLYSKDFKSLKMKIPSINEQKKIISLLEVLTKKEQLLEQKYQYYQEFKKYLMQQIFAQKLRFNFNDEWKVVKLETLIEKGKAGGTPSSTNSNYYNGDIPFLSIKDMTEQGKYIVKTEKSITEEGLNNSSAWIIPKYSLLYSIYASIGLVAINRTEISTSQAIYGIILKDGVSLEYMYYYLTYFKKNVHRYIETGTQGNLNAKLLKSFEVLLPSLEEQEMIVNMLSLVDEKIENTKKEIIKMNEFKTGLLQQMFV